MIKKIILKLLLKIKIMRKFLKKIINEKNINKDVRKKKYLINHLLSIIIIKKPHQFKSNNKLIFIYNFNHFSNYILLIIALKKIK